VDLFVQLERLSPDSEQFKSGSKRLAAMLGLGEEFLLSGVTVNDKDECPWPVGHIAHGDWERCRAMRHQIFQAVKDQPPLRLTDSELDAVFTAAAPIDVNKREFFMEQVARSLEGRLQHGPGDVHRAIVQAQKQFCTYPDLTRANDRTKFSRPHDGAQKY
jgi:hypothetical protein